MVMEGASERQFTWEKVYLRGNSARARISSIGCFLAHNFLIRDAHDFALRQTIHRQ
jgi:hypothetical protein